MQKQVEVPTQKLSAARLGVLPAPEVRERLAEGFQVCLADSFFFFEAFFVW